MRTLPPVGWTVRPHPAPPFTVCHNAEQAPHIARPWMRYISGHSLPGDSFPGGVAFDNIGVSAMTSRLTLLALALPLAASPALAQNQPSRAQQAFAQMDKNRDGALSLEEWKAAGRRERGFAMIDADHNGLLTPAELQAAIAKYRGGN